MKIDKTPIHWESIAGINLPRARFIQIDGRTRLTLTPRLCVLCVVRGGGGYKPPEAGANRVNWRYDFCLYSGGELGETKPEVPGHNLYFDTLQLPLTPSPT